MFILTQCGGFSGCRTAFDSGTGTQGFRFEGFKSIFKRSERISTPLVKQAISAHKQALCQQTVCFKQNIYLNIFIYI